VNDINILAYLSSSFISGFLQFVYGWSIEEGFVQLESFSFSPSHLLESLSTLD
jgi:hypothetical protein